MEEYSMLMNIHGKEEMQFNLPAKDIFSEEIRVLIHNSKFSCSFLLYG